MTDKEVKQEYYLGERVRALAYIYLTRRPELSVVTLEDGFGLDYMVQLHGEKQVGLRLFGVQLKGAWSTVPKQNADAVISKSVRETQQHGPFPFPVCLFFFTMQETQGWYTWVAEPVVDSDKGALLQSHQKASCQPLTDEAIDEMVDRVNHWYDAKFAHTV